VLPVEVNLVHLVFRLQFRQVQTTLSPACVQFAVLQLARVSVSLAAAVVAASFDLVTVWRDRRITTDIDCILSPLSARSNRGMARISRIVERGFSSFG
jgi:hypothetical protein